MLGLCIDIQLHYESSEKRMTERGRLINSLRRVGKKWLKSRWPDCRNNFHASENCESQVRLRQSVKIKSIQFNTRTHTYMHCTHSNNSNVPEAFPMHIDVTLFFTFLKVIAHIFYWSDSRREWARFWTDVMKQPHTDATPSQVTHWVEFIWVVEVRAIARTFIVRSQRTINNKLHRS